MESKQYGGWRIVFVGAPTNRKKMLTAGCPICKVEKAQEAKTSA